VTIEIHASTIKRSMKPAEIARHILKNPSQIKALAILLEEFAKNKGVLTKKQIYFCSRQGWCSRPSFYRILSKMRESSMIFVSPNYNYYFLRADFGKALIRLGKSWVSLVKSTTTPDSDPRASS